MLAIIPTSPDVSTMATKVIPEIFMGGDSLSYKAWV
jgi:hypothetical protein